MNKINKDKFSKTILYFTTTEEGLARRRSPCWRRTSNLAAFPKITAGSKTLSALQA